MVQAGPARLRAAALIAFLQLRNGPKDAETVRWMRKLRAAPSA